MHFAPCTPLRCPRFVLQLMQMRQICPRVATIRQRCSCAVDSRKSRAHKQLVQVASVCRDDDCVISPNRATAECTPPACVDRERLCESLFCELACRAANLNGRIRSDAEIRGLLRDAICVNSLFFWRVYKVEPKNHLFSVWQNDVEAVSVIPALRLVDAASKR
jgi:hypothetical protein